jgi:hypothetical protein
MVDAGLPTNRTDPNPYTFGTGEWNTFNNQISVLQAEYSSQAAQAAAAQGMTIAANPNANDAQSQYSEQYAQDAAIQGKVIAANPNAQLATPASIASPITAGDSNPYTYGTPEWNSFNDRISVLQSQATPTSIPAIVTPTAPVATPITYDSLAALQAATGRAYQPTDRVLGIAPGSLDPLIIRNNEGDPMDFSDQWALLDRGIIPILDYGGSVTTGPRVPNGVVLSAADAASLAGASEGYRGSYGGPSGAAAQNYNNMVVDVNKQLAEAPTVVTPTKAIADATVRPGYTDISDIGDNTTQDVAQTLRAQNMILESMGMPTVNVNSVVANELENQRSTATTLNSQQFFNNELQKVTENNIENMAAYHADAMASGVQQAANPFEYQADLIARTFERRERKGFRTHFVWI